MPATRNICAQLPLDLHQRVCESREQSGLTTAQYTTNLLIEYYEMKKNFPQIRGLELSEEKTVIAHIDGGFDMLGWTFRKFKGKLIVKPSPKALKSLKSAVGARRTALTSPKHRSWPGAWRTAPPQGKRRTTTSRSRKPLGFP